MLTLCSNSLLHDGNDMVLLVLDIVPQRVVSIANRFQLFDLYNSCKVMYFIVDTIVWLS
ncbi:hypothetical protein MUK42_13620 [Musa troglodytarum]|uniref:Uncharacterized protein n=1 Tax=Musa troglodytarum TaxID=320322 RepID=A0A9E7HST9_9LILI|nr:hypothetical protein MUK42_13620 [Musa troglodytarum]